MLATRVFDSGESSEWPGPVGVNPLAVQPSSLALPGPISDDAQLPDCDTCLLQRLCMVQVRTLHVFVRPECNMTLSARTLVNRWAQRVIAVLAKEPGLANPQIAAKLNEPYETIANVARQLAFRKRIVCAGTVKLPVTAGDRTYIRVFKTWKVA